ncbi:MAG: hypothetical protein WB622_04265 [Acidobacteriaceae bacterium]
MKPNRIAPNASPRHAGPPLLLPALIYAGLMIAGASTLNAAFQIPHDSAAAAAAYLARLDRSLSWGSFCEFASAVPLAIFVATVVSRLHFLRVRAAGATIALAGGILAAGMLLLSGLALWSLTRPGIAAADGAVRTLQAVGFAGGGPGFVVALGLFLAGVSVTAGLHRLVPRWIMFFGLAVALGCELASLTLVLSIASWCIPFGRFLSIVWMIALAICLPSRLPADTAAPLSVSA